MKNDPELTKPIRPGVIVQITPDSKDHALGIAVVTEAHQWGVVVSVIGVAGTYRLPWSLIELTGGALVFDDKGQRVTPTPVAKHHA